MLISWLTRKKKGFRKRSGIRYFIIRYKNRYKNVRSINIYRREKGLNLIQYNRNCWRLTVKKLLLLCNICALRTGPGRIGSCVNTEEHFFYFVSVAYACENHVYIVGYCACVPERIRFFFFFESFDRILVSLCRPGRLAGRSTKVISRSLDEFFDTTRRNDDATQKPSGKERSASKVVYCIRFDGNGFFFIFYLFFICFCRSRIFPVRR